MRFSGFKTRLLTLIATIGLISGAVAAEPYEKPDGSYISISGEVKSPGPSVFTLDYDSGQIAVEMDDWDWYAEGSVLKDGDKVTVYGLIDDDLFETRSIEASSVYVENLNTYFHASAVDEESSWATIYTVPVHISNYDVTGTVTMTSERHFTLDTGNRRLIVDTSEMTYNPLDDDGYQKIEVGDRVRVSGEIEADLFESRELKADYVLTLQSDDKSGKSEAEQASAK